MQASRPIKYFGPEHPFSHLHQNQIELFGESWTTVEQLYQYAKAVLGDDRSVSDKMKTETDGKIQKILSHKIRNKHPYLWEQLKRSIMLRLDYEKFTQHIELQKFLFSTGENLIIENNPRDQYWGGERNEAGKILMQIRDKLKGKTSPIPQILIIGDSILQNLNVTKMEETTGQKIQVISLPGARMEYIVQAAKFACGDLFEKLVIFGGTNDLATKDDKPRYGPNRLFRKIQYFEKEFHTWCSSTKLYICHILNRPRCKNTRAESHINWYNYMLDTGKWVRDTVIIPIAPFNENKFRDGLHLYPQHVAELECIFANYFA